MPPIHVETTLPVSLSPEILSPSNSAQGDDGISCFADLRGVQWRIYLGILPSTSSIDDLRRVTANSRRRYAALRRRLLVDPHIPKEGRNSPDLVMDNPLSQNPDSMWGRFFRNAELERMVDQDLSRLYPEHGSYFQTSGCQGMLRRILLLWCLSHSETGYRQGMHELLAPLLYVLHVDVEHLSELRKLYEDHFTDKFDGFSYHESDLTYKFDFKKFSDSVEDGPDPEKSPAKPNTPIELDPKTQITVSLNDAYGAEGELGVVLSEKFMEHDAYCMFDALMNSADGAVSMSEFFSPSPHTVFPPVIEASSALYHLLSKVDSSLHSHLVELGVEPQYFALRWLRVLFGREFNLGNLLLVWDEIFASDNEIQNKSEENGNDSSFAILDSNRGAFISAFAVSMILHVRSSLLATETATLCLQRLLNFPKDINLKKLIAKAKSLQGLAIESNKSTLLPTVGGTHDRSKSMVVRGSNDSNGLPLESILVRTPVNSLPESYWEEKWRVLHKEEECKRNNGDLGKKLPNRIKGWSEKVRLRLSRTESDPSPSKIGKFSKLPVRRNLLEDLARQLGSDEGLESIEIPDEKLRGSGASEENSLIFSDPPSPNSEVNDHENESDSSVQSSSSVDNDPEISILPVSDSPESLESGQNNGDSVEKSVVVSKERKLLAGKFPWLWKFGRNSGEGVPENSQKNGLCSSTSDPCSNVGVISKGEACDNQNLMGSLRNIGQSMLENIQVIESVFQQERGQVGALDNLSKNALVGRGQVTAMAALTELRKISNLLSEM